ncbi:La-related protein 6 isoform 1 [Quillaja saponaria]|uniref:La-related protein 6 isoform 1 n=1 Tax=Quillaja saponaria TaxID=32244 RepID=A0AAD7LCW0_QUISA|nr:La-related protein 6 isoform 1 [Quillaja saponaria]
MTIASSRQSFFTNALIPLTQKPNTKIFSYVKTISCKHLENDEQNPPRKNENKLAKLAVVTLAAGVLALGSVHDASAAKTGGRVGGQAFRSSAPRSSSPRGNNNSRTNMYINPPVAPPLVGGYGYGYGVPSYGGWGWSPFSFFAPGPRVAVGIGGGFELIALFMFLGAAAAVLRRFTGSRDEDDNDY